MHNGAYHNEHTAVETPTAVVTGMVSGIRRTLVVDLPRRCCPSLLADSDEAGLWNKGSRAIDEVGIFGFVKPLIDVLFLAW